MEERRKDVIEMILTAHNLATMAATKIESHEKTCADRYGALHKTLEDMTKMLWSFLGTSVILLLTALGALAFYIMTLHHITNSVSGVIYNL